MMMMTAMMIMMMMPMINEPGSLCGDLGHLFFHVLRLLLLLNNLKKFLSMMLIMIIIMMGLVKIMMVRNLTSPLPHLLPGSNKEKERSDCKH